MSAAQLTLEMELAHACKVRGCDAAVVGSSITGKGHVCKQHNVAEWGASLSHSREPHYRELGRSLTAEATT
jgi:hypothetical protein